MSSSRTRTSSPMRIMARLLGERKGLFAGNLAMRLIKDLLPFLGPILLGILVDLLSGSSGTDRTLFGIELTQNDVRSIIIVAVAMALLAVTKTIVGYIHTIVSAHTGRHVVQAARRDLADASMKMALDERRRFNSGDLLDRCLADSKGLRGFTQNVIIRVISNTVRAVFPLVYMFTIDAVLAVVVLVVIPVQSSVSAMLQRRLQRQTHEARSRESLHTSAVKEAIDGWNNVASVGGQDWAAQGIHQTAAASEDAKIVKKHTTASISAVISLCTAFGIAAVYAIGGWRIIESGALDGSGDVAAGALTLGSLTAFVGVAKKTYAPFQAYTKIVSSYRTGLVNLERIADVLDAPMIDPRHDGPDLQVGKGDITLNDVSFTYSDGTSPTLRALNGNIPGQSLTVITGSSGAGKTTLLRLLLGLDIPGTGSISIDGQDINKAKFSSVQKAISLVPQEPVLFTGTMSENLLLGLENITTKQLLDACDRAGLVDLVREMPNGLDTEVGSGKHMLSGGQLRRMAIARALLRQPGILLLDEPTTGLDVQNSSLVLNTLRRISSHTTVVMVSHRSEPLKASDHHLILQNGSWVSSDDHQTSQPSALDAHNRAEAPVQATIAAANGHLAASASNGTHDSAVTNGTHAPATSTAISNGSRTRPGHIQTEQQVLALSAMGRPIFFNGLDHPDPSARVLLVSGHRVLARPITAISSTVFAHLASDPNSSVALASIEDINPDGSFCSRRETVLGVAIERDHRARKASETRTLHAGIEQWQAEVLIDVAEQLINADDDAEITVRFVPDADGNAPASAMKLGQAIRANLSRSPFTYRVSLLASLPGSITSELGLSVIEISAQDTSDQHVINSVVAAIVATTRAVSEPVPALA